MQPFKLEVRDVKCDGELCCFEREVIRPHQCAQSLPRHNQGPAKDPSGQLARKETCTWDLSRHWQSTVTRRHRFLSTTTSSLASTLLWVLLGVSECPDTRESAGGGVCWAVCGVYMKADVMGVGLGGLAMRM